jgi:hypothetical protein
VFNWRDSVPASLPLFLGLYPTGAPLRRPAFFCLRPSRAPFYLHSQDGVAEIERPDDEAEDPFPPEQVSKGSGEQPAGEPESPEKSARIFHISPFYLRIYFASPLHPPRLPHPRAPSPIKERGKFWGRGAGAPLRCPAFFGWLRPLRSFLLYRKLHPSRAPRLPFH